MNKAKLVILILVFSTMCSLAGAVEITDINVSDNPISYLGKFDIKASVSGISSSQCDLTAEFYMDDLKYDTRDIPCGATEIKGHFGLTSDDWVAQNIQCGMRELRVEIHQPIGNSMVTNKSIDVAVGVVPNVEVNPEVPQPGTVVTVRLTDPKSGDPLSGVDVTLKDVYGGDPITSRTQQDGTFTFTPTVAGEYHLSMSNRLVCGETSIFAKRPLMIDGPRPDNPVINEMIQVAVPAGSSVGVKVLDANGNTFLTPPVSFNGGANFSINQAGTYTLVVGDQSTKYWSLNKTFVVSDRLMPEVKVAPEEPIVGKTATITVSSRGQPLSGAVVTIKRPDGVGRDYPTSDYGTINYDGIPSTGVYSLQVTKDRFGITTASFEAKHAFTVKYDPQNPTVKDTITLTVNDQNDKPVSDALVEVPELGFKHITDMAGKISFNLQQAKEYQIKVTKDLFWDGNLTITPYGVLSFGECLSEFELGKSVTVQVYDSFNSPTVADLSVRDPDGIVKTYSGSSQGLTPDKTGRYVVTASKTDYINSNITINVLPHPIYVNTSMAKGQLTVRVTSNGANLSLIPVSVAREGETLNGTTNDAGVAVFGINREGNITVTANLGRTNRNYDEATVHGMVVRSYDLILLTTPLVIIFAITLMTIIAIQLGRMYLGDEGKMPSFQSINLRPPAGAKTKHDSTLLNDKKPAKSRLSKI